MSLYETISNLREMIAFSMDEEGQEDTYSDP